MDINFDKVLAVSGVVIPCLFAVWFAKKKKKENREESTEENAKKVPTLEKNQNLLFKYKDELEKRVDTLESTKAGEKLEKMSDKFDKFASGHIRLASKVEEGFRHTEKRLDKLEEKE